MPSCLIDTLTASRNFTVQIHEKRSRQSMYTYISVDSLYCSTNRSSIIAVCGIDGHAYGSWQGRSNLRPMWLRHFLAKDLPICRVIIYGYEAKLTTRGTATVEDYSREFLENIKRIRRGEVGRDSFPPMDCSANHVTGSASTSHLRGL